MSEPEAVSILERCGAILPEGHYVYTSGQHGSQYVQMDRIYNRPDELEALCDLLAEHLQYTGLRAVIGPAEGGNLLACLVAARLGPRLTLPVTAIMTRKLPSKFFALADPDDAVRHAEALFNGRGRIVVVEDILNTGGSARRVADLVRSLGGHVVAVGAIWNRGGVTVEEMGAPITSLVDLAMEKWPAGECPLCKKGVPVNTTHGHGKEFLAAQVSQPAPR